jgi:formate hydrogenlyase subunit 4
MLAIAHLLLALLLAPLLPGLINRTKAWFAGRRGPPLLQVYRDLAKLLRKGVVRSRTTSGLFVAGPVAGLAATALALVLVPWGRFPALLAFPGDFLVLAYLLAAGRFLTVLAALDTGSSFEGMGASREVTFAVFAELTLLLALAALARATGELSLSPIFARLADASWSRSAAFLALIAASLFLVYLTENARIPVDDPNTHLELTMIHEVLVLDHSGPWLAMVEYAAALKLWLFGALLAGVLLPAASGRAWLDRLAFVAAMLAVAIAVGVVESCMARLRLLRIPQLLLAAAAFPVLAFLLLAR